LDDAGLTNVTAIKIDVEGAELEVLRSAAFCFAGIACMHTTTLRSLTARSLTARRLHLLVDLPLCPSSAILYQCPLIRTYVPNLAVRWT
jgi:hypothetical protein